MKEQWTKDLQQKMNGFEVPTIPEGLWENIDAALETGVSGKPEEQATITQHLTPNTRYWRKACAAILLLLAIPTAIYFINTTTTPNPYPSPMDGEGGTTAHNAPIKEDSKIQVESPSLSTPSAKHIAKATVQKTTIAEAAIDNGSNSSIEEQVNKVEEVDQNPPITQKAGKSVPTPSTTPKGTREEPINNYGEDELIINKKQQENRLYLAMNASGINFSGDMTTTDYMGYDDYYNFGGGLINKANEIPYHEETHHRPISIGLQVGIPVAKDWSVVTGLTYTYLHSEIKDGTGFVYDYIDQKLHFVGVPVQMNYQLYNNRHCNIYLGAGGRADIGVSGKTNHENKLSHLPVNYSLKAAAGVQVNIFKSLNIYAEPTIQYNIPGSTRYKTYYTEHKTMFDLQLGVRFTP